MSTETIEDEDEAKEIELLDNYDDFDKIYEEVKEVHQIFEGNDDLSRCERRIAETVRRFLARQIEPIATLRKKCEKAQKKKHKSFDELSADFNREMIGLRDRVNMILMPVIEDYLNRANIDAQQEAQEEMSAVASELIRNIPRPHLKKRRPMMDQQIHEHRSRDVRKLSKLIKKASQAKAAINFSSNITPPKFGEEQRGFLSKLEAERLEDEKESPIKVGWLKKESGTLFKKWKPRYVVLLRRHVYYYVDDRDEQEPQGFIPLVKCLIDLFSINKGYAFKLTPQTGIQEGTGYIFLCENEGDRSKWTKAIRKQVESVTPKDELPDYYQPPPFAWETLSDIGSLAHFADLAPETIPRAHTPSSDEEDEPHSTQPLESSPNIRESAVPSRTSKVAHTQRQVTESISKSQNNKNDTNETPTATKTSRAKKPVIRGQRKRIAKKSTGNRPSSPKKNTNVHRQSKPLKAKPPNRPPPDQDK